MGGASVTLYIQQWGRTLRPRRPSRYVRVKLAIARFLLRGTSHRLEAIPPPPEHLNCRCTIVPYPEK